MSKEKVLLDKLEADVSDSDDSDSLYELSAEEDDDFDDVDMDEVDKVIASYQASSGQAETSTPRHDPNITVNASEGVQGQPEGSFHSVLRGPVIVDPLIVDEDGYHTEEFRSLQGSDDEDKRLPEFQPAEYGRVRLEVGMTFPTMKLFKEAVKDYNIALGKVVNFKRNEKTRSRVHCAVAKCSWTIFASWAEPLGAFQVKTFKEKHSCCRQLKNPLADRHWVGNKLVELLRTNPRMNLADARRFMSQKYQVSLIDMNQLQYPISSQRRRVQGSRCS